MVYSRNSLSIKLKSGKWQMVAAAGRTEVFAAGVIAGDAFYSWDMGSRYFVAKK